MTASKTLSDQLRWPLFLAYSVFLYFCFTLSANQIPSSVLQANDKALHFFDFLILPLLAFRAFSYPHDFSGQAGKKSIGFSLFYATLLEWIQTTVPSRVASLTDWGANVLGVLVAAWILQISK